MKKNRITAFFMALAVTIAFASQWGFVTGADVDIDISYYDEETEYFELSEGDEFLDDTILITISHNESFEDPAIFTAEYLGLTNVKSIEPMFEETRQLILSGDKRFEEVKDRFHQILKVTLSKESSDNVLEAVEQAEEHPDVIAAEPDMLLDEEEEDDITFVTADEIVDESATDEANASADDTYLNQSSSYAVYTKTKIYEAWDLADGSYDVRVGIMDSGIMNDERDTYIAYSTTSGYSIKDISKITLDTTELKSRIALGGDFSGATTDANGNVTGGVLEDTETTKYTNNDINGHGTKIASIIGAIRNNGVGTAGVCKEVTLVPLKVSTRSTHTYTDGVTYPIVGTFAPISAQIAAYNWANANNVQIINYSGSGTDVVSTRKTALENFRGLVFVSAGNNGYSLDTTNRYPACYDSANLITVGGTDSTSATDAIYYSSTSASGSNYSSNYVDIAAPYNNFRMVSATDNVNGSTVSSVTYAAGCYSGNGTSYSTPLCAAVAALCLSVNPDLTTSELKAIILDSAAYRSSLDGKVDEGRFLDAEAAVQMALDSLDPEETTKVSNDVEGIILDKTSVELDATGGTLISDYVSIIGLRYSDGHVEEIGDATVNVTAANGTKTTLNGNKIDINSTSSGAIAANNMTVSVTREDDAVISQTIPVEIKKSTTGITSMSAEFVFSVKSGVMAYPNSTSGIARQVNIVEQDVSQTTSTNFNPNSDTASYGEYTRSSRSYSASIPLPYAYGYYNANTKAKITKSTAILTTTTGGALASGSRDAQWWLFDPDTRKAVALGIVDDDTTCQLTVEFLSKYPTASDGKYYIRFTNETFGGGTLEEIQSGDSSVAVRTPRRIGLVSATDPVNLAGYASENVTVMFSIDPNDDGEYSDATTESLVENSGLRTADLSSNSSYITATDGGTIDSSVTITDSGADTGATVGLKYGILTGAITVTVNGISATTTTTTPTTTTTTSTTTSTTTPTTTTTSTTTPTTTTTSTTTPTTTTTSTTTPTTTTTSTTTPTTTTTSTTTPTTTTTSTTAPTTTTTSTTAPTTTTTSTTTPTTSTTTTTTYQTQPGDIPVDSVKFSGSTGTVAMGDVFSLRYTVYPADATMKDVYFEFDPDGIVSYDAATGKFTALKPGTVEITVVTVEGQKKDTLTLTVTKSYTDIMIMGVDSLTVRSTSKLTAVTSSGANLTDVSWSSSDPSIADIDSSGLITGKSFGTATITATDNLTGLTASIEVYITQDVVMKLNSSWALKNGKDLVQTDPNQDGVNPTVVIRNFNTMIPLRFISETMGAQVSWNDATQTATVTNNGVKVEVRIGSDVIVKTDANNVTANITIPTPAMLIGSSTYIPLRAVSEALGFGVTWFETIVDGEYQGYAIVTAIPEALNSSGYLYGLYNKALTSLADK